MQSAKNRDGLSKKTPRRKLRLAAMGGCFVLAACASDARNAETATTGAASASSSSAGGIGGTAGMGGMGGMTAGSGSLGGAGGMGGQDAAGGANGAGGSGGQPSPPPCWALDFTSQTTVASAKASAKLDYGDAYTVEAWALWRGQGNIEWQYLVMQGWTATHGDFVFRMQIKNAQLFFTTHDEYGPSGQFTQTTDITGIVNNWAHIAGVYESGQARLYINGKLAASGKATKPSATSQVADIHIGNYADNYPFDGVIDEVRISKGARYTGNFVPPMFHAADAQALALWRFDEGSGSVTADATGNKHDATHNATWTKVSACQSGGAP